MALILTAQLWVVSRLSVPNRAKQGTYRERGHARDYPQVVRKDGSPGAFARALAPSEWRGWDPEARGPRLSRAIASDPVVPGQRRRPPGWSPGMNFRP